ncbi:LWR-salt protein [Halobacteria archaeon AArc-dxtr1]|nr:LWR-salt protein [Halobacteria archaeon AArc-dxtr1]
MNGQYVFRVGLRLETRRDDVRLDPTTAETTLRIEAAEPGTEGWRFFRDTLWRGELSDPTYGRELIDEWVEPPVDAVEFRELQVDDAYRSALQTEIADDLDAFNAETVTEVLSKYLGSSIRVMGEGEHW